MKGEALGFRNELLYFFKQFSWNITPVNTSVGVLPALARMRLRSSSLSLADKTTSLAPQAFITGSY
jgi:hypothetical protein